MSDRELRKKIDGMSSAAKDVMRCMFFHGPTWDGDVPSKSGRDELVDAGLACRLKGWQALTEVGFKHAIECFCMDEAKDVWQRQRDKKR